MNIPGLVQKLHRMLEGNERHAEELRKLGFAGVESRVRLKIRLPRRASRDRAQVESVTYEALSAFEHGDLDTSTTEWHKVFTSWGLGDRVPAEWIAKRLRASKDWNSRPAPSNVTQSGSIYNYAEVRAALLKSKDARVRNLVL